MNYLPGVRLPDSIHWTNSVDEAVEGRTCSFVVVPALECWLSTVSFRRRDGPSRHPNTVPTRLCSIEQVIPGRRRRSCPMGPWIHLALRR